MLSDSEGKTVDTYVIDTADGTGTDSADQEVNLPQTGNNSLTDFMLAALAFLMLLADSDVVYGASASAKKKTEPSHSDCTG